MKHRILPILAAVLLTLFHPSSAHAACASPAGTEGDMLYNSTSHVMQYCDNNNVWNAMGAAGPGAGGAGCSGPADPEGTMFYNKTYHMLQWCDGTTWHAVTGATSYNSGLVGWWKFDETTGTSAADSSGNGNTGTLTNAPTWGAGKINGALGFVYTSSQYVNVGIPTSLQLTTTGTVSAWVKYGDQSAHPQTWDVIAGNYANNTDTNGYSLITWNNHLTLNLANATSFYDLSSPLLYDDNNWHHAVGTWDGTNIKLYVDGVQVATNPQSFNPVSNVNNFNIGRDSNGTNAYFSGTIDDVRVWNRALSAAEVYSLYSDSAGASSSLIGRWKFDEGSGTSAADSSGNGLTGTLNGGVTWTAGKVGSNAITTNGSTGYVSTLAMPSSPNVSIAFWAKTASTTANQHLVSLNFYIACFTQNSGSGQMMCGDSGTSDLTSTTVISDGNWHHFVYTATSTPTEKLYVDGVLNATAASPNVPYWNGVGGQTTIGMNPGGGGFFNGSIDDVRVYLSALTAADALSLYNGGEAATAINNTGGCGTLTSGLVGWWKMDEGSGATTADASGNSNTGTLTNSPTWTTSGKINGALTFANASNNYVDIANPANFAFERTQPFTLAAWVYRTNATTEGEILAKVLSSTTWAGYTLWMPANGGSDCIGTCTTNCLEMSLSNGTSNHLCIDVHGSPVTTNAWHHVVATYDGNSSWTAGTHLYVDGVLQTPTGSYDNLSASILAATDLKIGTDVPGQGDSFTGKIDDVRVWNRALSGEEVAALFAGTALEEGQLMYNAAFHIPQFCDGTTWHATK